MDPGTEKNVAASRMGDKGRRARKGGGESVLRADLENEGREAGLGPTAASVPQMSLNIYPELTASKRANETCREKEGANMGWNGTRV